jgi:hypothetical protein
MDGGYGQYPRVRNWMADHALPYVVAMSAALPLTQSSVAPGTIAVTRADDLPSRLADHDWQRRSCGEGSNSGRYYEENNEQGKDLIGIDQHQARTWTRVAPHHHRVHVRPGVHRRATHAAVAAVRNLLAQTVLHACHDPAPHLAVDRLAPQTQGPRPDQPLPPPRRPLTRNPKKWVKRPEVIQV